MAYPLSCHRARSYGVTLANTSSVFYEILIRKGYFIARPYPNHLVVRAVEACSDLYDVLNSSGLQVRAPLCANKVFYDLAVSHSLRRIVKLISSNSILNQQNLLFVPAGSNGHEDQSRWHRDMPYQAWLPQHIAIFNALLCLGPEQSKSYHVLDIYEGSHHCLDFPLHMPKSQITKIMLRRGEVLFMNSFLYHRAPLQATEGSYILNTVFAPRCFKQQVHLPQYLPSGFHNYHASNSDLDAYLGLADKQREPTILTD